MAWIEVHQSLRGHKKLSKLCELIKDWQDRDLDTKDDIERNREDFFA